MESTAKVSEVRSQYKRGPKDPAVSRHLQVTMTITDKKADAILAKAFHDLPKRLTCPKCRRSRAKKEFGLRVMQRDSGGVPVRVRAQSWCRQCRGGH